MFGDEERISWQEAEQVVRLHRLRHENPFDVSVSDLAEALDLNQADVHALVAESRGRRRRRPYFVDRSGLLSAGIAAAAALLVLVGFLAFRATSSGGATETVVLTGSTPVPPMPTQEVVTIDRVPDPPGSTNPAEPQVAPVAPDVQPNIVVHG